MRYTLSVMIEAEEQGVTQANADEMARTGSPAQKRLTGAGDDMGKALGLDPMAGFRNPRGGKLRREL